MLRPLVLRQLAGEWIHLYGLCSEQAMRICWENTQMKATPSAEEQPHSQTRTECVQPQPNYIVVCERSLPRSHHMFTFVCVGPGCFQMSPHQRPCVKRPIQISHDMHLRHTKKIKHDHRRKTMASIYKYLYRIMPTRFSSFCHKRAAWACRRKSTRFSDHTSPTKCEHQSNHRKDVGKQTTLMCFISLKSKSTT